MKIQKTFDLGPGSYFGGKGAAGVVHTIINQIPKHKIFISGFLGRCQVMQWKKAAEFSCGYDLDPKICELWEGKISVENESVLNRLDYDIPRSAFLYLDPPYLQNTRKSDRDRYDYELTDEQHADLIRMVLKLDCMVMISHYPCPEYDTLLRHGWRKIEYEAQTRAGLATEALYMNYTEPAPHELHDTRFLGSDFRAREVSKRRLASIRRKITRLTPMEKAILANQLPEMLPEIQTRI